MKKIVAAFALEQEVVPIVWDGVEVKTIVTGIGKTATAIAVTKALLRERPDVVLNVGTCGTFRHKIGDVVVPQRFVDRDIARLRLPELTFEESIDPSETAGLYSVVDGAVVRERMFTLSTGDDFVTEGEAIGADVVDMEGYAALKACRSEGVRFLSVKYVTDIIGQNSVQGWREKLADARNGLAAYFKTFRLENL